jgi:phospholipase/carboxylesterase
MITMAMDLLPCVELGAAKADYSIIWLHGLGANGHDFEPIVPELNLPAAVKIRFVFPHAPQQAVTINSGTVMPAWYDIVSPQLDQLEDETGVHRSQQYIETLIERENARGVAPENIILAGFSQGGAIALHTGLRHPRRLAGIIALSTYMPLVQTVRQEASKANQHTPIFMAHGRHDPIIPLHLGEDACHYLKQLGYEPEWKTYFMEHSVCPEEIRDISHWLCKVLTI